MKVLLDLLYGLQILKVGWTNRGTIWTGFSSVISSYSITMAMDVSQWDPFVLLFLEKELVNSFWGHKVVPRMPKTIKQGCFLPRPSITNTDLPCPNPLLATDFDPRFGYFLILTTSADRSFFGTEEQIWGQNTWPRNSRQYTTIVEEDNLHIFRYRWTALRNKTIRGKKKTWRAAGPTLHVSTTHVTCPPVLIIRSLSSRQLATWS